MAVSATMRALVSWRNLFPAAVVIAGATLYLQLADDGGS